MAVRNKNLFYNPFRINDLSEQKPLGSMTGLVNSEKRPFGLKTVRNINLSDKYTFGQITIRNNSLSEHRFSEQKAFGIKTFRNKYPSEHRPAPGPTPLRRDHD